MQLVQTRLLVPNGRFNEAYDFYADVLGLAPQRGRSAASAGMYEKFSFPRGDAAVALQARAGMEAALALTDNDRSLIVIRVDDVDAVARTLTERGVTLVAPPANRFGLRAAYVRDSEGNLVELQTW